MKQALCILIWMVCSYAQAETVTAIYQASHKSSQKLLEIIDPLYDSSVAFTRNQNQLIIRGEKQLVNEVQELLLQLDQPERTFVLEISNSPSNSSSNTKTYSTQSRNFEQTRFSISEGAPLIIVKSNNQQQSSVSTLWFRAETLPQQQEALRVELLSSSDNVELQFQLQQLHNGKFKRIDNKVSGPLNQWLPVVESATETTTNSRNWSAGSKSQNQLYIKVSPKP